MKPFLKWPGGKTRLADRIAQALPPGQRLIEPFVGSGAVFMNVNYPDYHLADVNGTLINLFRYLQEGGSDFIEHSASLFTQEANTPEVFYARRSAFNASTDPFERSLLFLYLNRHCFNGLVRFNRSGEFNSPMGKYRQPYFPRQEMLAFHTRSRGVTFAVADFATTLAQAKSGDVVYCDPPYVPLSETSNFTSYAGGGFDVYAQIALVRQAESLATRGITVVISNHDTEFTRHHYAQADIVAFDVQRSISRDGANRGRAKELLAIFRPAHRNHIA